MTRFIEYTDKSGVKALVNLNLVEYVVDRNKSILLTVGGETVHLSISYKTFKDWLNG